ncbi:hypothetical protein D9M72_652550 [compost metagenome]
MLLSSSHGLYRTRRRLKDDIFLVSTRFQRNIGVFNALFGHSIAAIDVTHFIVINDFIIAIVSAAQNTRIGKITVFERWKWPLCEG